MSYEMNSRGLSRDNVLVEGKLIKIALWTTLRSLYGIVGSAQYEFSILHIDKWTFILHTKSRYVTSLKHGKSFSC